MNRAIRKSVVVSAVVLLWCGSALAQPTIPKEQIPEGINELVGHHINMLYSADARQRYEALCALSQMGGRAAPAVPFVVNMLGDKGQAIVQTPPGHHLRHTSISVGGMAAGVLGGWCHGSRWVRQPIRKDAKLAVKPPPPVDGEMVCQIVKSLVLVLKTSPDKWVRQQAANLLQRDVKRAIKRCGKIKTGPEKLSPEQILKIREVVLEGWLTAIRDKNSYVRNYAAMELGETGNPKVVDLLIEALGDQEGQVPWSARGSLVTIRIPAIKPLIATIPKAKSPIRERAAEALSQICVHDYIHEADALKALHEALKHKDPLLRASAAKASRGPQQSTKPLIIALKDEVPEVRAAAAWSLVHTHLFEKKPHVIQLLIALITKDKSPEVRAAAVWSLRQIGPGNPKVAKTLLAAMKDESPAVRTNAAAALKSQRGEEVVRALLEALKDSSRDVRREAAGSLGIMQEKQAVKPLIRLLKDKDNIVRYRAAKALGNIKDNRAVGPLIEALSGTDDETKRAAQKALCTITGQKFGFDQAKWRKWFEKNRAKNEKTPPKK